MHLLRFQRGPSYLQRLGSVRARMQRSQELDRNVVPWLIKHSMLHILPCICIFPLYVIRRTSLNCILDRIVFGDAMIGMLEEHAPYLNIEISLLA